jgi:F0F1-type ATP synthase epsilon subunit
MAATPPTPTPAPTPPAGMHVKVYSPYQVYFDDQAQSVSGVNETGAFDILPKHHNFLTLLSAGELTIRTSRENRTLKISRGLMNVKADRVVVFLDV